jgi:hypothetical protein
MRLPRMTTRRWMIYVVVVALSVAGEQMRRRAVQYRRQAERHAKIELACRQAAARLPLMKPSDFRFYCGTMVRDLLRTPRLAAYHADLRCKYEYAARYPWLPVEPDPPPPEP